MSRWRWLRARFSFHGRASRREYWLQFLCAMLLTFGSFVAVVGIYFLAVIFGALSNHRLEVFEALYWPAVPLAVMAASFILYLWAILAVTARRWHDLGRPFRFNAFAPSSLDGLLKRGTIGHNDHGPDPLQKVTPPS